MCAEASLITRIEGQCEQHEDDDDACDNGSHRGPQGHWRPNMSLPRARRPCRQPDGITSGNYVTKRRVLAPVHLTPRPSLGNGLSTRTLSWRGSVAPYKRDTASVHEALIRGVLCRWPGLTSHAHLALSLILITCVCAQPRLTSSLPQVCCLPISAHSKVVYTRHSS